MFDAISDALSRAISMGDSYGIIVAILAFVVVLLYHFTKGGEQERLKRLSED